jgi:hypothetical protein
MAFFSNPKIVVAACVFVALFALSAAAQQLTVTGKAPLVDTASSQVADTVNPRQMEELPLQGRNWMELS